MNSDGSGLEIFARGIRNTVGFDWNPATSELWFTDNGRDLSGFVTPERELGPHVAALGMRCYTGTMFPAQYHGQIFIAEHCSWNRNAPIGYRITPVRLDGNRAMSYETFAEGWLQGRSAWGRPVDVQVIPDGAILVSDDLAEAIYRISWQGTTR